MTSNIDIDEGIIAKIDEKLFSAIEKDESIMETDEYKRLFAMAKKVYPYENVPQTFILVGKKDSK